MKETTTSKRMVLLFIILTAIQTISAQSNIMNNAFPFRHLTINNGLSHTDANVIVQDKKNYIWIGTYSGLDRYDGLKVKSFYNELSFNKSYLNRISDISIDSNNKLWLATFGGIQLFDPETAKFIQVVIANEKSKDGEHEIRRIMNFNDSYILVIEQNYEISMYRIGNDNILIREPFQIDASCYSFKLDQQNRVWISSNKGVWILDKTNKLTHIVFPLLNEKIFFSMTDKQQNLFVGTENSIIYFPKKIDFKTTTLNIYPKDGIIIPLDKSAGMVTDIVQTKSGDYWVSTLKGLFNITKSQNSFTTTHINTGDYPSSLNSGYINKLLIDRSENLFVATFGGGVNILDLNNKPFYSILQTSFSSKSLSEKIVRALVEDGDNLWVGLNTMGLYRVNKKTAEITFYNSKVANELRSDRIKALNIDRENFIWIGHSKGISILSPNRNRITCGKDGNDLPVTEVSSIAFDCFNQAWIGTWDDGICRIRRNKQGGYQTEYLKLSVTNNPAFSASRILTVYSDYNHPEVFFSTEDILVRIFLNKDGDVTKTYLYSANQNKKKSLSSNFVYCMERQNDSILWVGCIGGGLNRMRFLTNGDYEAESFSIREGLKMKDIESLHIDNIGNIWIAGNGLVKYNPASKHFISYASDNESFFSSFKAASCKGKNGELYFGGVNGFVFFNPQKITDNKIEAKPEISDITINNQIQIVNSNSTLKQSISYLKHLKLKYFENNFIFHLASLHYSNPSNCKFRYRMKGFDKEWVTTDGNNPYASYANLPFGNYVFELQASNNDEIWSNKIKTLEIEITPPWYLSILAKVFYFILLLCILIAVYYYLYRWLNLKKKLEITEITEKKNEQLHQSQLQFFTNISHDFRTPLTLISGSVEQILMEEKGKSKNRHLFVLEKNAKRMIELVNELMDFRKVETNSFLLGVKEGDINLLLVSIADEFQDLANANNIRFDTNIKKQLNRVWFDVHLVEKIILNLLNNAFKYTKKDGCIEIDIILDIKNYTSIFSNHYTIVNDYAAKSYFYIRVRDNGYGISKESIDKVFNRYYQVEDSEYDPHIGSGVGLALVKSLVLLHKGFLIVNSERNKGSEFIVALPSAREDYSNEELALSKSDVDSSNHNSKDKSNNEKLQNPKDRIVGLNNFGNNTKPILLIVEDNDEVREFLIEVLCNDYAIQEAVDGIEALALIEKEKPDLIISDLMMPRMNGNKLCISVKNNPESSSIPFIILTAKDTLDSKIEGINDGADSYLGKPINIDLLKTTLRNLQSNQKRIKKHISSKFLSTTVKDTLKSKDREFYELLIKTIELNIDNQDLDVELLSRLLSYSRTKLYQHVNEITGKPLMELVRSIRLQKATQIMAEEDISIQEIITRIGIQSQSYFTIAFKKEFGKTPSQYIRDLKDKA